MGIFSNISPITSKYASRYVGNPNQEIATLGEYLQKRQDNVLSARDDLQSALDITRRGLDDEDGAVFNVYAKDLRDKLNKLSSEDYVGNLDNHLRNQAVEFKNTASHFVENSQRKQKFREALSTSGLSEEEQMMHLLYARKKSGNLTYNPATGRIDNKFMPVEIIKNPDTSKVIERLKNEIVPTETTLYVDPSDPKKQSKLPFDGALTRKVKERRIDTNKEKEIENMMLNNADYAKYIQRMKEMGGNEYAYAKHQANMASIFSGLRVGDFSNDTYEPNAIAEDVKKHIAKKNVDKEYERKEDEEIGNLVLPTPANNKLHNFERVSDIDRQAIKWQSEGNNERANSVNEYKKRKLAQYGLSESDYNSTNWGVGHNESYKSGKEDRFRMLNEDLKKDANVSTTMYKTITFNKESQLGVLDRSFQHSLGNLTTGSKKGSSYIPEDLLTGKALNEDQMKKLNNAKFSGIVLTSNGAYYVGRSSGSDKNRDSKGDGSSDSDFNFRIKVPNQIDVLTNLVSMKKLDGKTANSMIATQGIDDNFGQSKPVKTDKGTVYVKRILPSEKKAGQGDYEVRTRSGEKEYVDTYQDLLKLLNNI